MVKTSKIGLNLAASHVCCNVLKFWLANVLWRILVAQPIKDLEPMLCWCCKIVDSIEAPLKRVATPADTLFSRHHCHIDNDDGQYERCTSGDTQEENCIVFKVRSFDIDAGFACCINYRLQILLGRSTGCRIAARIWSYFIWNTRLLT